MNASEKLGLSLTMISLIKLSELSIIKEITGKSPGLTAIALVIVFIFGCFFYYFGGRD